MKDSFTIPKLRSVEELDLPAMHELFRIPSQSGHEHAYMIPFLAEAALRLGCRVTIEQYRDSAENEPLHCNLFITKGYEARVMTFPCVSAHIDNVQPMRMDPVLIERHGNKIIGRDPATKEQAGFGADCKTGIAVCLELLRRLPVLKVAFFSEEEVGCQGARGCDREFFEDVGYVIEFDCPSANLMSYTSNGVRLFDNDHAFIKKALPVLQKYGVKWQNHPYTDIHIVRPRFNISCLNLASGYYRWHAQDEYAWLPDMVNAVNQGIDLIQALGINVIYPFSNSPTAPPLVEVECLAITEPVSHPEESLRSLAPLSGVPS